MLMTPAISKLRQSLETLSYPQLLELYPAAMELRNRTIRSSLTERSRFCGFEPARHHRRSMRMPFTTQKPAFCGPPSS